MAPELPQHSIQPRALERRVQLGGPGAPRVYVVRAISGEEERKALGTPGVQRALTAVLAACVHVHGDDEPLGAAAARALSSGERVRLALTLAAASSADGRIPVQAPCPAEGCAGFARRRVALGELRERSTATTDGVVRVPIAEGEGVAEFRIPDGADQEAVEAFSSGSRRSGLRADPVLVRLLDRLLLTVDGAGAPSETALWSDEERRAAWEAIREAMGGPDTDVALRCADCGHEFSTRLSPLGWLRDDPQSTEERLLAEIRTLARHYGWDEETALCLPRPRRLHYLSLL